VIKSLDPAALDRFFTELVDAGFEPVEGKDFAEWEGPIAESFAGLILIRVQGETNYPRPSRQAA